MGNTAMLELLQADEEKLRNELRADSTIDQNLQQSVRRLREELSLILLRYNAANSDAPLRQALADSMAAPAQDLLELINSCDAKKEIQKRRVRTGAVIALLLTVIFALCSALLVRSYYPVGCVLMGSAAVFGFVAGRLWYGEREVRVRKELNAELVLRALKKSVESMDRKSEEFFAQKELLPRESASSPGSAAGAVAAEDLKLCGELLEALYSDNGDYALRQLRRLPLRLQNLGFELRDYRAEDAELFELLPSKKGSATLRPAILKDGKLLLAGRATEVSK